MYFRSLKPNPMSDLTLDVRILGYVHFFDRKVPNILQELVSNKN